MNNFIYQSFPQYLPSNAIPEHFIEVCDFQDGEYGNVFYKGQHLFEYQGESFYPKVHSYHNTKKMITLGLDITKAKIITYNFDRLDDISFKEASYGLNHFNLDKSQFLDYPTLLNHIQLDLAALQPLITAGETKLNKMCPTVTFPFITFTDVEF